MAFNLNQSRKKLFSALIASTFMLQLGLAVSAADGTAPDAVSQDSQLKTSPFHDQLASAVLPQTFKEEEDREEALAEDKSVLMSPLLLAAGQPSDSFILAGAASMTPDQAQEKIDTLTKDILLKEIELERYNLHYTTEVARQGRWKSWRYGGLQQVNTAMGLTGAIISTSYRGARLNDSAKVKPCIQESANYIPEIGCYIGAGAAAIEFGINGMHDLTARRRGYGPAAAMRKVAGLKTDIDRMLAERDALTRIEASGNSPNLTLHAEIDAAEGKVLRDLRDQGLLEFERFHVGARRLLAFQQMQYFFDFSKNVTNGLGYEFAYLSLHRHHRRFNGNAGALFITSGALTMFGPIVSRTFGKGVAEITRHRIKPIVGDAEANNIANLEADLATLNRLLKQSQISPTAIERTVAREGMYGSHQKSYTEEIRTAEKNRNKAKLTATQNIGAGLYVGGTKVASGVCFAIAGFNHHYNVKTVRANHVTNDLLFTASVIAIPASSFSFLDTLRIQVQGEIRRQKAKKAGTLTSQLVAARLAQLDEQEKRIRAINP